MVEEISLLQDKRMHTVLEQNEPKPSEPKPKPNKSFFRLNLSGLGELLPGKNALILILSQY